MASTLSATDLARHTPATRDRYVDFLRLFSIAVVVLGHWLMAVVIWHGSSFHTGNVIGDVPGLWLATWLLQVMPIFFFVGGFANLVTIDGLARKGKGGTEFVASRIAVLMRPVAVLLAVWIPAAFLLERVGLDANVLRSATKLVCQPLWFIGVYLAVTALAPAMRRLHARFGVGAAAALFVIAATVDVVRFGAGIDALGYVNLLVVWLFAQQLGFFYGDGTLLRCSKRALVGTALGALGVLAALVAFGPYPASMVGLPGDKISNMSPPTICLAVLTVFEVAMVMLLRAPVQRFLQRERAWTVVVAGNGVIMTVFLWHLTAALLAIGVLYPLGFPQPAGGSAMWWATRPLWIAVALVPLAGFVKVFGRFERPQAASYDRTGRGAPLAIGIATVLLSLGVFGISSSNLADLFANKPVNLAVVSLTPIMLAIGTAAGLALSKRAVRCDRLAA